MGAAIAWGAHLWFVPIGVLFGLPQLVPFFRHLPKTIRMNQHDDIGKVPWWHFSSLVFPQAFRYYVNGVGFWEMSYYVGLIPLFTILYTTSRAVVLVIMASLLMIGAFGKFLPKIPARWSYTFQVALIWCAIDGLNHLHLPNRVIILLCLIQAFDLWRNNSPLLVNHPYAELYQRPSWAFDTKLTTYLDEHLGEDRVSGLPYPLFTGHINEFKTLGYAGGMQTKEMAAWRNDTNSNGSGEHDWFKSNGDGKTLDEHRVRYAYTTKRIPWANTCIPKLYRNPRLPSNRGE